MTPVAGETTQHFRARIPRLSHVNDVPSVLHQKPVQVVVREYTRGIPGFGERGREVVREWEGGHLGVFVVHAAEERGRPSRVWP